MKKILIWGATDTLGGVEAVLWNYTSNISNEDFQFDFINTYEHISIEKDVRRRGGKVFSLPNRRKNVVAYKKSINEFMFLHANEYDVVWLNDCMFGNIDILKLAKKYNIQKRIIHAHNSLNMGGGISRLIRHKINAWRLRFYVTDYWACSRLAADWSYPNDINKSGKVKIIPNAVDLNRYKLRQDLREKYRRTLHINNEMVFGHVGRFHFQKNHIFLIDIFSCIHNLVPNSKLLLVGTGEEEEKIRQRVLQYSLNDCVLFLGERKDVPELYQAMDAFLLPSLFEGLPVVMVEAQAGGLPCFVSDTITRESDISGNVEFIPLEAGKEFWAKTIIEYMNGFNRIDTCKKIKRNGYSIDCAAEKLVLELGGVK